MGNEIITPETSQNNNVEKNQPQKNTPLIIIIIVLCLLLIGAGGYIVWDKINNNSDTEEKNDNKDNDDSENEHIEPEKKYSLNVYGTKDYLCLKKGDSCKDLAFTISTKTEEAKVLNVAGRNYVLYQDEKIYLYNNENKKIEEVSIPKDSDKYDLLYNYETEEVSGLSFSKNEKTTYYNLETKSTLYANKYEELYPVNNDFIYAGKNIDSDEPTFYLLNAKKEEPPLITKKDVCAYFSIKETKDSYFILLNRGCVGGSESSIYTKQAEKITDYISGELFSIDENLRVYENKKLKEYNTNGELIKTYDNTGDVKAVYKDIYVSLEDNILYIKDYNGQKYKMLDWKKEYYFHSMISGYYNANDLSNEQEKAAGYYFIIETGKNDMSASGVEYYFNPKTKEIKSWELSEIGGYAKPILYLYPEAETEVTVNFEHEEKLTTTYPKFKDEWKVTAKPNGDLYDENGKYYYGLYWEEDLNHQVDFSTGFYVTKDDAIDFLEEKLATIGLKDKEKNEFIMYWLPILEKNGQSLVYFELTEERDTYNKLQISPNPDSLLRIAIHVKKVNDKVNIKEEKLPTFNRIGFTAVEWGGVIYK